MSFEDELREQYAQIAEEAPKAIAVLDAAFLKLDHPFTWRLRRWWRNR